MITGKNYIGNQLKAEGTTTHKTVNPKLNTQNSTPFFQATLNEVNEAVELADSAFKVYRNISGKQRAAFLNAIADEILALDTELTDMYMSESGLPKTIDFLMQGMGSREETAELSSYILFDSKFTSQLVDLGYKDMKEQKSLILDWL